jgi:beta-phosphoglucomutase family hydrolase
VTIRLGPQVSRIGLPIGIRACLFDLDGVLTDTARLHRVAWTETFDAFLRARATAHGSEFEPFDPVADYDNFIDGKLRYDGVRAFLASRRIHLAEGTPSDPPASETICGLGNRKERNVITRMLSEGVVAFPGSVRYLEAARAANLRRAVVSSSTNCAAMLRRAGLDQFAEERVDGRVAHATGLRGKPAPDTYLEAAKRLGVEPAQAAVFEDAIAGVEAGLAGRFGFIVGVARNGDAAALLAHGANVAVDDLSSLLSEDPT